MIKKIFIFISLVTVTVLTFDNSVEAGFFKRLRSAKNESKKETVEAPKPVIVALIYASWCPGCKNIQPTIDQIEKELGSQIEIIYFDVSTPKNAIASAKKSKELKLDDFYNSNKSKTSTAAVIVQKNGEVISIFQNNNKVDDYKSAIQEALTKAKAIENPPT